MKVATPNGIINYKMSNESIKEFLSGQGLETNLEWYTSNLESYKKPLWRGMMRYTKMNDDLEKKISKLHYDTAFFLRQIHRKKRSVSCLSRIKYILNDHIDNLLRTKPKRKVRKGRKIRKGRRHYWWYFD